MESKIVSKIVIASFWVDGKVVDVRIPVNCLPTTSNEEVIRRAGNLLRSTVADAVYGIE